MGTAAHARSDAQYVLSEVKACLQEHALDQVLRAKVIFVWNSKGLTTPDYDANLGPGVFPSSSPGPCLVRDRGNDQDRTLIERGQGHRME
jgi:hypothetical protein